MLSRSSFKADLAAYRASMKPLQKPGARGPLGIGNLNTTDAQLIERWIDDGRAEEIWSALKKRNPGAEATSFIRSVLAARRSAQATVNRFYRFKAEWAAFFPALKRKIGALSKNLGPLDVAVILDNTAQDLRHMHLWYSCGHPKFELSRKDQNGSRRRRLFMQIMGEYFSREYGAPFDDHAATLAKIALADHELHRDHARNARRPTTTQARSKKRRGGTFRDKKRG
jgi:hypothetical protein